MTGREAYVGKIWKNKLLKVQYLLGGDFTYSMEE